MPHKSGRERSVQAAPGWLMDWLPAGADAGHAARPIDQPGGAGGGGPQNQFAHARVSALAKYLQILNTPRRCGFRSM
jgi:hypothetical protein